MIRGIEAFFAWMGELFVKHPLAFIFTLPLAAYLTFVFIKFVKDDVDRRNKKLGYKAPDSGGQGGIALMYAAIALFGGLLFGSYSLLVWLGQLMFSEPNF
jgi:hypothetical protein